eukprot:COSAG06_NODE_12796_length_1327_cov_27.178121_1_plen_90_part_00
MNTRWCFAKTGSGQTSKEEKQKERQSFSYNICRNNEHNNVSYYRVEGANLNECVDDSSLHIIYIYIYIYMYNALHLNFSYVCPEPVLVQ